MSNTKTSSMIVSGGSGGRGRPPMDCDVINTKAFQRKKEKSIKKAQEKKCASRANHPKKPCVIDPKNGCVSASKPKEAKCHDVKPLKDSNMSKAEKRSEFTKRCKSTGPSCVVSKTKKLTCKDKDKARAKAQEGKYIPGMYKY